MWFRFVKFSEFSYCVTNSRSSHCVAKNPTPIFRRRSKPEGDRRSRGHNVRRPLLPTVLVRISAVEGRSKLSLLVLTQSLRTARKIAFVPLPNCQPVRRTIEIRPTGTSEEAQNRSLQLGPAPSKPPRVTIINHRYFRR